MVIIGRLALGAAICAGLFGCGREGDGRRDKPDHSRAVTAFVAASTRDAVREAAAIFTREQGTEVRIDAGASSKLATQITQGAPADVFLSASEEWGSFVRDQGLAQESRPLVSNQLVLIVPKGNPAGVNGPKELTTARLKRLALAGPRVPAGEYARQALRKLGLWDELNQQQKVVSGDDVRVALAYVERGEVEAGIVYATDARASDQVEVVYTFDAAMHDPVRYPLLLLKSAADHQAVHQFYEFLRSREAAAVFQKYGFTVPTRD
jgi:molybdate transport system substrate-binding protein